MLLIWRPGALPVMGMYPTSQACAVLRAGRIAEIDLTHTRDR